MTGKPWQEIRDAKKAEQAARIPPEWKLKQNPPEETRDLRPYAYKSGILSDRELEITDLDATSLIERIANGSYTVVEVVTAYCKRAALAQQLANCLTEIAFAEAIERAKVLDDHYRTTGKVVGPLHGVPMSFKECFNIKGYDSSNAYISKCFNPAQYDAYLVEIVKKAGAVPIAKTNIPQTMLVAESDNNVFGSSKNPVVAHLSCGGSSGGEGVLMAYHGSAIGIGTDVGGSIRIPAACNGVYGYKPSFGLLPMLKYANSTHLGLNTGIPAVCGPLARSVRDLELLTRVVRDARPWLEDPAVMPHVFEQGAVDRKPVVGVIYQADTLTPHPPIRRALRETAAKLEGAGLQVKEFEPASYAAINEVTRQLFTLDGLSYAKRELAQSGEPPVPAVRTIGFWDLPSKTSEENWSWNAKKQALQKEMLEKWRAAGIDIVLCPAGAHTAPRPGQWSNDSYTVTWNAMDYPAIIMPITHVDPAKDPKDTLEKPLSATDDEFYGRYDPELMAGSPVALQLVGSRLGDEQLLKDAELIDKILKQQHGSS
ncbi:hypothetical protein LTR10_021295 [Elasticomyces elasticus]|nr:hypothetical protein LTR10_021295 [Elasticomyces elasticus]KAK5029134.1 hypothetical protein LTR13_008671 [Exophiala sideris]